jgi:hypothetical protein
VRVKLTNPANGRFLEFFCTNGPNTNTNINTQVGPIINNTYEWNLAEHPTLTPKILAFTQQSEQFGYEVLNK